jgi:hypothetical protein
MRLDRDLRRNFAVVVTAHAVGDDHQQRIARVAVWFGPRYWRATLTAFLINGESHLVGFLNVSTKRPSQFGLTFGAGGVTASTSAFCRAKTLCGR